ncbi:MAG: hypothetical protein N2Z40_04195 [Caldimicrobium sp.]|nr:hypothetical protein [Caldimicrobium sp.]MCX7613406.1 hypothetical protein [Caldimicrobium sp.]MDW8182386.1 hypothetical protein [Caldimicrobium sp.]
MNKDLKIEVYMNMSCSSETQLRDNISRALELEGVTAEVTYQRLSDEEARKLDLRGSPTIRINGEEVQPLPQGGFT